MPSNPGPEKDRPLTVISIIHKIEDGILILLLMVMILMAVLQIALRNFFDSGILWGDGLVKVLVLWIGLFGAMIASRYNHHISIDVISRFLPRNVKRFSDFCIFIFTAIVCAVMSWYSFSFALMEKEGGMTAFSGVPAWICESIIPFAFGIICLRYLILSFQTLLKIYQKSI